MLKCRTDRILRQNKTNPIWRPKLRIYIPMKAALETTAAETTSEKAAVDKAADEAAAED